MRQSVSVDGDRIIVGAPLNDDQGQNSGAAYVFKREGDLDAFRAKIPNLWTF